MRRFRAILFDLDDTLYPEEEYIRSGFTAVASWLSQELRLSPEEVFSDLWTLYVQGARGNTFDVWLASTALDAELKDRMVQVYRDHRPDIAPMRGATGLLRALSGRYRLGLISDGLLRVQQAKLAALGLAEYLDCIVFSDEFGRHSWKPSTVPYRAALQRLGGVPAETCAYVGDNPLKDFIGARELGMFTVRIRRIDGVYAALEPPTPQHAAHITIAALEQLEVALQLEVMP